MKTSFLTGGASVKKTILFTVLRYLAIWMISLIFIAAFSVFGRNIEIYGIKPNVSFALCGAFAVSLPLVPGMCFSISVGLFADWLGSGALGFHSLLFMLVCLFASNIYSKYFRRTFFSKAAMSIAAVFTCSFISWLLLSYIFGHTSFWYGIFHLVIPETLYSAVLLLILISLLRLFENKEMR